MMCFTIGRGLAKGAAERRYCRTLHEKVALCAMAAYILKFEDVGSIPIPITATKCGTVDHSGAQRVAPDAL